MLQQQLYVRELAQAWAAFDDAFNLLGLGDTADRHTILDLADAVLAHLHPLQLPRECLGELFVSARREDAAKLITALRGAATATRADLGILLLAVEFLLRASQYQNERGNLADCCTNCGSPQLVQERSGHGQRCLACGLTTTYPTATPLGPLG